MASLNTIYGITGAANGIMSGLQTGMNMQAQKQRMKALDEESRQREERLKMDKERMGLDMANAEEARSDRATQREREAQRWDMAVEDRAEGKTRQKTADERANTEFDWKSKDRTAAEDQQWKAQVDQEIADWVEGAWIDAADGKPSDLFNRPIPEDMKKRLSQRYGMQVTAFGIAHSTTKDPNDGAVIMSGYVADPKAPQGMKMVERRIPMGKAKEIFIDYKRRTKGDPSNVEIQGGKAFDKTTGQSIPDKAAMSMETKDLTAQEKLLSENIAQIDAQLSEKTDGFFKDKQKVRGGDRATLEKRREVLASKLMDIQQKLAGTRARLEPDTAGGDGLAAAVNDEGDGAQGQTQGLSLAAPGAVADPAQTPAQPRPAASAPEFIPLASLPADAQALFKQGKPVQKSDGSVWQLNQDGNVVRVK